MLGAPFAEEPPPTRVAEVVPFVFAVPPDFAAEKAVSPDDAGLNQAASLPSAPLAEGAALLRATVRPTASHSERAFLKKLANPPS